MVNSPKIDCGTGFKNKNWMNIEPCGVICGFMTWGLLIFGMYASTFCVILPWLGTSFWGLFHLLCFNGMSILGMYNHLAVMLTDPGAVPKECVPLEDDVQEIDFRQANLEGGVNSYQAQMNRSRTASRAHIPVTIKKYRKFCKRCKAFKPIRAHHCSICGRCIIKMDHHCPWVNNCVGIGNQKLFLLFLLWVNLTCIYSLLLVISKFIYCAYHTPVIDSQAVEVTHYANPQEPNGGLVASHELHHTPKTGSDEGCGQSTGNLVIVFLLVEALLFGLFTLCMLGDQSTVLTSNQTQIDKLKGYRHEGVPDYNEVFGCSNDVAFSLDWFLPIPAKLPDTAARERILGYRMLNRGSNSEALGEDVLDTTLKEREVRIGIDNKDEGRGTRRHSKNTGSASLGTT